MELSDFVRIVPDFAKKSHIERIKHFGWYLHTYRGKDWFSTTEIRLCYESLHLDKPNISDVLISLTAKKPKEALRKGTNFCLEHQVRREFDAKYANRPASILVDKMLSDLPSKVNDEAKRKYLSEALGCYRVKAYRAAIIMMWNLAYDHLLNWILTDATRLAKFNAEIPIQFPRKAGLVVARREDFEELKESEVVRISSSARLISGNVKKVIEEKLTRRNISAHPATIEITQYQAEDTVSDLVHNVVLKLL